MVERLLCKQEVDGSIPFVSTRDVVVSDYLARRADLCLVRRDDRGHCCQHRSAVVDAALASRCSEDASFAECGSGDDTAYLVPAEMWRSISETAYLLRSPANAARLRDAIADADAARNRMDANFDSLATA